MDIDTKFFRRFFHKQLVNFGGNICLCFYSTNGKLGSVNCTTAVNRRTGDMGQAVRLKNVVLAMRGSLLANRGLLRNEVFLKWLNLRKINRHNAFDRLL